VFSYFIDLYFSMYSKPKAQNQGFNLQAISIGLPIVQGKASKGILKVIRYECPLGYHLLIPKCKNYSNALLELLLLDLP
jgi:hypothetical protein